MSHKERIIAMVERISEPHILKRIDSFVSLWYSKSAIKHPQEVSEE